MNSRLILPFLMLAVAFTHAEPEIIYQSTVGNPVPIDKYISGLSQNKKVTIDKDPDIKTKLIEELKKRGRRHGSYSNRNVILPIQTPTLSPGNLSSKDEYFPDLVVPLFVVGSDDLSISWLDSFREQLIKIGAIGWIVQAETEEDLRNIATAGRGLKFMPANGDYLSKQYNITHYPVLITQRSVEQ